MQSRLCVPFAIILCSFVAVRAGLCAEQAAKGSSGGQDAAADLRLIKSRLVEMVLAPPRMGRDPARGGQGPRRPRGDDPASVERLATSLRADGSWEDLIYRNATPRDIAQGSYSDWGSTSSHLARMEEMARAYRTRSHPLYGQEGLRDKILLALDFWLRNDFRNVGWWQDQIGTQERLGATLLLMDELLSPEQRKAAVKIMQRSQIGTMTSANLLWMAGNQITWGCIAGEVEPVADAYRRIANEVRIAPGREDGIKADQSYYFHGEQLYAGGYGLSFTVSCARLAYVAAGTRFALPPAQVKILTDFVLEGQRWMTWGSLFDYTGVGREICRRNKNASGLAQPCRWLEDVCPERKADFAGFAKSVESGSLDGPVGNRHYWKSDTMVHRRDGFYASVRMLSSRMKSGECTRGEGLKSHHLADGVTFLYRDGKEYVNIFPVWDWRRLPGITCVHSDKPLIPPEVLQPPDNPTQKEGDDYARRLNAAVSSRGQRDFVGGVSDGACGLAAMDFVRGPLAVRKAWFFLDREIVCLGTGINSSADDPVLTSVNQCLLRGPVTFSEGQQPASLDRGKRTIGGACSVHHDGVGYVFPDKAKVVLTAEKQEGNWHDIVMGNRSQPAAEDVFSLWIDHGRPVSDGQYCYVIVPGIEAAKLDAYAKSRTTEVLRNAPAQQAVWQPEAKRAMAAFYEPGRVKAGDMEVSVDRPCLLLAKRGPTGLDLSVSNPENRPLKVTVEVNVHLDGPQCEWIADRKVSRVTFDLPSGEEAGRTVSRQLSARPM